MTRAAAQARELAAPLESAGATVFVCPLIKIETREDDDVTRRVLRELDEFSWIVFTSVNGVELFTRMLTAAGMDVGTLADKQLACVGPATAAALERHGLRAQAMPEEFLGDAVAAKVLAAGPVVGRKILLARAGGGAAGLPEELRRQGAQVEDLELYRSVLDTEGAARLHALIRTKQLDMVTFTAGSAATYFGETIGTPVNVAIAVIGPSTASAARNRGLHVDIEAKSHTIAGLVAAILEYYAAQRGSWRIDAGK